MRQSRRGQNTYRFLCVLDGWCRSVAQDRRWMGGNPISGYASPVRKYSTKGPDEREFARLLGCKIIVRVKLKETGR